MPWLVKTWSAAVILVQGQSSSARCQCQNGYHIIIANLPMKMPTSCITLAFAQVSPGTLIRSLHHGGRAPTALLWGEEKLTLDNFLSFTNYFTSSYKAMSHGGNGDKATIRPVSLTERQRDLCGLLCQWSMKWKSIHFFQYNPKAKIS